MMPSGAAVLVAFIGAGTTCVTCLQTRHRFLDIELDAVHFGNPCNHMNYAGREGALFDCSSGTQDQARMTM